MYVCYELFASTTAIILIIPIMLWWSYIEKFRFVLFDFVLYIHGKQLRSCQVGHLLNHTVPGQAYCRQFTIIIRSRDPCLRNGHATDRATAPGSDQ